MQLFVKTLSSRNCIRAKIISRFRILGINSLEGRMELKYAGFSSIGAAIVAFTKTDEEPILAAQQLEIVSTRN